MRIILYISVVACLVACKTSSKKAIDDTATNPPAIGFNLSGSDEQAMLIADQVMLAMGGRKNWDNTRYLTWNFFGRRTLLWDKWQGDVRIQMPTEKMDIYLNVNDSKIGKLWRDGVAVTQPDTIAKYVARGKSIWINDSYWLVMPFKLKDTGLKLEYKGKKNTGTGISCDLLQLTFNQVGDTPNNKYLVYVDEKDHLVKQWDYFAQATDEKPAISSPWQDYQQHGKILLSGNRGARGLTNIAVYDVLPDSLAKLPLFGE